MERFADTLIDRHVRLGEEPTVCLACGRERVDGGHLRQGGAGAGTLAWLCSDDCLHLAEALPVP